MSTNIGKLLRSKWGAQTRLAEALEITPQAVQSIANGERPMPAAWVDPAAEVLGLDSATVQAARALDLIGVCADEDGIAIVAGVIRASTAAE